MRQRGVQPQTHWLYPPIYTTGVTGSSGQTVPATGPTNLAASPTTTVVDLTTICGPPTKAPVPQGNDDWSPTPIGHRIMLQADGDNIYVAFGDSPTIFGTLAPSATTGTTGASFGAAAGSSFTGGQGTTTTGMKLVKDVFYPPFELPIGRPPPGTPANNSDQAGGHYSPARYMAFASGTTGVSVYLRVWPVSD